MTLASGVLWPMPITLDVPQELADQLQVGGMLALRAPRGDARGPPRGRPVAPEREREAQAVFGTTNREHPGVAHLLDRTHPVYVAAGSRAPAPLHYDFQALRARRPRSEPSSRGGLAHRRRVPDAEPDASGASGADAPGGARRSGQPVDPSGRRMTKPGDVDHYTRVRCYQALLASYPPNSPCCRSWGSRCGWWPREAVWHAIIRKNTAARTSSSGGPRRPGKVRA